MIFLARSRSLFRLEWHGAGCPSRKTALRYVPSGREPVIQMFSRSGPPFAAKAVTGVDRTELYKPIICTPEALDARSGRNNGHRRLVDVRSELLPLLFAEMTPAKALRRRSRVSGSAGDGASVRERPQTAWRRDRFEHELASSGHSPWQVRR